MTSLWLCNFSCVSLAGRQAGSVSRPCHDQGRFQPDTLKHRETVSWEVCCHLMLIMTWGWLGLTSMIHPMFLTRMSHLVTQSIWRRFVHKKAKGPMSIFQAPPGYQEQTTKAWQGWFYRRFPDKDYHWSESSEEDTQMYQDWYNSTGEHYNSSHHGRSAISSSLYTNAKGVGHWFDTGGGPLYQAIIQGVLVCLFTTVGGVMLLVFCLIIIQECKVLTIHWTEVLPYNRVQML